jgi:hypothetical protein
VDRQGPSPQQCPVEVSNGRVALYGIGHLDKAKAAGTIGVSIQEDPDAHYLTVEVKELRQVFFRGRPGQIPDKDIHG